MFGNNYEIFIEIVQDEYNGNEKPHTERIGY